MNSKRTKRNLFKKSLLSGLGLMMACSVAVADQPRSRQQADAEKQPASDESRNRNFIPWTDEVDGSGVATKALATDAPWGLPSTARIAQRPAAPGLNAEARESRELHSASKLTIKTTPVTGPLESDRDTFLSPARPLNLPAAKIAMQAPTQDASKAEPPAKRINLMDSDMSYRSPDLVGGRLELPLIEAASTSITNVGNGRAPAGFRSEFDTPFAPLPEQGIQRSPTWGWSMKAWNAPNTFSNPLYFEDRMLERHGHERFPHLTPLVAGMRFFTTVPMLPYLTAVDHPLDCDYSLGYYRSGSCTPAYLQRPPYERRAVIAEAAAVSGVIIAFP